MICLGKIIITVWVIWKLNILILVLKAFDHLLYLYCHLHYSQTLIIPSSFSLWELSSSYRFHSTIPAFMDELSTWNKADPTTRNKNKPKTTGPTGIFSSRPYWHVLMRKLRTYLWSRFTSSVHTVFFVHLSLKLLSSIESL